MNSWTLKIATLGCALAALFVLAAPAHGATRPDDRSGVRGVTAVPATTSMRPDDRAGFRSVPEPYTSALGVRTAGSGTDGGFDWTAAGAGAGVAAAVVLILLGALRLRRSNRHAQASA
jgi:hypothetical protein